MNNKNLIIGEFYQKTTDMYIMLRFRTIGEAQSFEKLNRIEFTWLHFYES